MDLCSFVSRSFWAFFFGQKKKATMLPFFWDSCCLFFGVCSGDFRQKSLAHLCAVSVRIRECGSFSCKKWRRRMKIKELEPTYLRKMTENQGRSGSWNFFIQWRSSWTPRRFLCAMRSSWNIHPCFWQSLEITLRLCCLLVKIVPNICSYYSSYKIIGLSFVFYFLFPFNFDHCGFFSGRSSAVYSSGDDRHSCFSLRSTRVWAF